MAEPIRTFEQYRRRFFPTEVERERVARLTPEQRGKELAQTMLKRVARALDRSFPSAP
jgi:hypothetical protein